MNTLPAGTSSIQGRCQDVAHDTRAINACLHWSPESCRHACLWSYESVLLSHGSSVVRRGLCRQHPARVPFPPVTPVHASQRPTLQPPRVCCHYSDCPSAALPAQRVGQRALLFFTISRTQFPSRRRTYDLQEESTDLQGKRLQARSENTGKKRCRMAAGTGAMRRLWDKSP